MNEEMAGASKIRAQDARKKRMLLQPHTPLIEAIKKYVQVTPYCKCQRLY